MNKIIKIAFVTAFAFFVGTLDAEADSGTGYLCRVLHVPGPTTNGNYGWIRAYLRSEPLCGGTHVALLTLCSAGRTGSVCPDSDTRLLGDTESMSAAAEMWQNASVEGVRVFYDTMDCYNSTDTDCLRELVFSH